MDAKLQTQQEKLKFHLQLAATIAAEIQASEQGKQTPHFDDIEKSAHVLGQQLGCLVLAQRTRDVAAEALAKAACPECHRQCAVQTTTRTIKSMDGPFEITETVAHCSACRRDFFPSACCTGA